MPDISILNVELHGKHIGTITRFPDDRNLFAFSRDYIENAQRDTLSLSFKTVFGELDTDTRPTRLKLPTFFSNLLPEGHLRTYLAGRAGVNREREFYLMWVLGEDLPGALRIIPADGESWSPGAFASPEDEAAPAGAPLHFSLAGVQLKFSAVKEAAGGLTIPANGVGGSWIVKLPSERHRDLPQNEYAMMELARRIGIDIPETRLVPLAEISGLPPETAHFGSSAFAIKRFDRLPGGGQVHTEDFAQVFGVYPANKYRRGNFDMIARVLAAEAGEAGVAEFIRRFAFNALIGNGDMHLKNWSVIYPDKRTAAIAPAYDFVATRQYMPDEQLALNFADTKSFEDLDLARFERFADRARIPRALVRETLRTTVDRFQTEWDKAGDLALSRELRRVIDEQLKLVPIATL